MPVQFQHADIDFDALAGIGRNIGGALDRRRRENEDAALANEIARLTQGGATDYNAIGNILLKHGRPEEALRYLSVNQPKPMSEYQQRNIAIKQQATSRPTAADKKAAYEAEDTVTGLSTTLKNFEEAEKLLDDGIYDGYGAGIASEIGTKLPGGVSEWLGDQGILDIDKAQRTQDYLSILTPQAMQFMAEQLKGSTAYQEMLAFTRIYADPSTPNKTKAGLLRRLINATKATIETKRGRLQSLQSGSAGTQTPELVPGLEVDGFEFLGGDPNDQNSWRAIQ